MNQSVTDEALQRAAHIEAQELEKKFDHGWENPPSVMALKSDLEEALPLHEDKVNRIDEWLHNLNSKRTPQTKNNKAKAKVKSEYQPRLIRKQAEWRYPSLSEPFLNTPDMFTVSPRTYLDKPRAIQAAAMLNYQFNNKLNKVEFIDELVRAAVDEGTAIIRTAWDYRTRTEVREVPEIEYVISQDTTYAERIAQLIELSRQNPAVLEELPEPNRVALELSIEQGRPVMARETGKMVEEEYEVVVADQPALEVCDYRSVIVDPTCKGVIENANFVIYKFETSKAELQAAGIYKNLELLNLDAASILAQSDSISDEIELQSFNFKDDARKRIVAYEYWGYWDTKGDGNAKPIVATFVNNVMIRLEDNPFNHGKLPFDVVKLMPKRKEVYGEPDGELILDNQKVVGALSRGMIDLMAKAAAGQTAFAKGFLDPLNRQRYNNQQSYEFNPITHPEQAIYQHKYPEIPMSAYNMIQMHQNDAESFTGVKAFAQGLSGDSLGSSVGGIRSALDAAGKRELSILRRLVNAMLSVGKKILSMNAQFLDGEQYVQITDEEFIEVNPDDLTGEFDLKLDISTAEADNEKAAELAFMLQTMGNNAPFEVTKMILVDIARLRKMPALAKQLEEWNPQPDPYEEQMKQVTLQLEQAKATEMEAQAKRNLAAAEKDLANARKLSNEADKIDLDYVEQETGTQHARELESMRQQSEGNMRHELLKQSLEARKEQVKANSTSNNS